MNGVQTRFKCKLDVKRCKRFVFPPSSLLPRSNALKTKAIRYFQTDRTLTRIVSPPLKAEALKNMPEVELQLNDKSMYGEKGRIETISGVVDRNTGTASLRAVFPNKNGLLYSGTSGNVILPVTMKGSLVIPQATTFEIQDITYVYKVVDGKAQSAPVSVTRVNGGQEYIVNDGLKEGDVIVAEGVGLLREGTPIKVKQN